jgi:two-component system, NtrC family, nitrogen regulation response regulator NtrX
MALAKILVVDDEGAIRRSIRDILEFEKYEVVEASNGMEALVKAKQKSFDVIILDIKMPQMDGMEALGRLQVIAPDVPVIMISGHGDIDTALEAVRKGAFDYLGKPFDARRLLITVRNALDKSSLVTETKTLRKKVTKSKVQEMIGSSKALKVVKEMIDLAAPVDSSRVLILGPNGTGKELVARWIHEKSQRVEGPMVEVNCAAIPATLIESELFGHVKGAFTDAKEDRIGKFEQANNGTIFLDEIGDMSLEAQAKVLRALQEKRIMKVGGNSEITVNVRVIAATNKNLRKEIMEGRFREDLYHRLAVVIIKVPALNDRREDIPELVDSFIQQICTDYGISQKSITPDALALLQKQNWTGNIRELRNVVERLIIFSKNKITENEVNMFVVPTSSAHELKQFFDRFPDVEQLKIFIEGEYKKYKEAAMESSALN